MIDIKFIPTGHIFSLPDSEAIRIVSEDRGNYQVVKGKVPEENIPQGKKSVQELVVVGENKPQPPNKNKGKGKNKTQKEETPKE